MSCGWLGGRPGLAWLDAFDFTMFLLIMVPISQEFHVPLTDVAFVLSVTLWLRLLGAVGSGWLADRVGRKIPLMISILWYSLSNFAAGFSPTFTYLFLFRALLGIGMGGEWPAGAALAMETWPVRSRGFMGGVLQGSWGLGFMLSSAIYGLFYAYIGWRGMLWIGVLPALSVFYVRKFVKEPPIWLENRRRQRVEQREVRAPLISIFKPRVLGNTLTACLWMAGGFVAYYSVNALFATHLQKDLHLTPGLVATPIFFANLGVFLAACGWGWWADRCGRRWAIIIPALIALPLAPLYLLSAQLPVDRGGLRRAGIVRRRRHAWIDGAVLERTLPDRDTGDRERLLLPPGGDLRRLRAAGIDLLRRAFWYGISGADDHWHVDRLRRLGRGGILRARDQRQGSGARSGRRLKPDGLGQSEAARRCNARAA